MKLIKLASLIIIVFALKACTCQQKLLNMERETTQTNSEYTIEYTASSKGGFKHIFSDGKTILTTQKRGSTPSIKRCDQNSWDIIKNEIERVGVKNILTIKAPSKKFQFDGAAMARLKISDKDSIYETPPFDHGNPPKEIEELVKEILSISEIIE